MQKFTKADLKNLGYMNFIETDLNDFTQSVFISRLGYTGEDGFEISINNNDVVKFWQNLCADENIQPIGLAARDSLRLEMGYPLHGHDIDENTTPIEANLAWIVSKTNKSYYGADIVFKQKEQGASKKRVGIKLLSRGIAREGAKILAKDDKEIGILTSGGFSPFLKQSIGQGYVDIDYCLLYTSPSPRDLSTSRMPSSA